MNQVEQVDDEESSNTKYLARLKQEVKFYETKTGPWMRKAKKIVRRYKDDRNKTQQDNARFNILWSNVELLKPALFAKNPVPNIERRNRIKDDLGRVTSMALERCITFYIDETFKQTTEQSILDMLLTGRGTSWVRYEPKFETVDSEEGEEITDTVESETYEQLADEKICWDFVPLEDFGHSWGRFWAEVDIVWRKAYLTKKEMKARFSNLSDEEIENIPLDYSPTDLKDTKVETVNKKATIYEAWDKSRNTVYWFHVDYKEGFLDEQKDPLELDGFFPCPKPLFTTLANDSCIPTPDYVQYQDQAIELDSLTGRIAAIVKAIKVAGVYDASAEGIQRLLSEGVENQLIPVAQWAMLGEKGGLKGVITLLPMEEILNTLKGLYESRDQVKQEIFELTGISDILRGASDPKETYGAQRIKSQFGTLRLSYRQDDVQRYCRDLIYIGTQIIAKHYDDDTIKRISNMTLLTGEEKMLITINQQYQQQMAQFQQAMKAMQQPPQGQAPQPGQPPQMPPQQPMMQPQPPLPPPPLPAYLQSMAPDDTQELMDEPTWEEILQFMKQDPLLNYRIDVETDSTIKSDQEAEKASRIEFLKATSSFLQQATQITDPALAPLAAELLMFGVRGFKIGRDLEGEFEETIKKLKKEAENPQPKPNPEMQKIQAQTQLDQQKLQLEEKLAQQKAQADQALEQQKAQDENSRLQLQAQVDAHQGQVDAQLAQQKAQLDDTFNRWKTQMDNETKIVVAQIQAKAQLQNTALSKDNSNLQLDPNTGEPTPQPSMSELMNTVTQQLQAALAGVANQNQQVMQSHQQLAQAIMRPRKVIYDDQGNVAGVQ